MYRVDVYALKNDKPRETYVQPPLYVCLATTDAKADSEDGRLLTVGRKNATILLENDKSVSREHTQLCLLSNNEDHQKALLNEDDENNNDKIAAAAGKPTTQEEKDACALNPLGMALLVKNLGKYGTTVLALAPNDGDSATATKTPKKKKKSDGSDSDTDVGDDDGGSDTEDESQQMEIDEAVSQGKLPTLPNVKWYSRTTAIATSLFQRKSHKIVAAQKLEAKQSLAIPGNATTILLQCGAYDSLMILTRMDLQICPSAMPKKEQDTLQKQLYSLGAIMADENTEDVLFAAAQQKKTDGGFYDTTVLPKDSPALPPTTYMTVAKRQCSAKQLVAWNLGLPFVNLEFLRALMMRTKPQDEWPNICDYDPPSNINHKDLDDDFWTKTVPQGSRLWETCTYLSTSNKANDSEQIVKAAGGTVLHVYNLDDDDAKATISALMEDPVKKDGVFAVAAPGRTKIRTWIKSQGVPHLKANQLTLCMCKQEPLKEEKTGRIIAGSSKVGDSDGKAAEKGQEVEAVEKEKPQESEEPKEETKPATAEEKPDKDAKRKRGSSEEKDADVDLEEAESQRLQSQSQAKKPRTNKESLSTSEISAVKEDGDDKAGQHEGKSQASKRQRQEKSDSDNDSADSEKDNDKQEAKRARTGSNNKQEDKRARTGSSKSEEAREMVDILPPVEEENSMNVSGSQKLNETAASADMESQVHSPQAKEGRGKKRGADSEEGLDRKKPRKERRDYESEISGNGTARLEKTKDGWLVAAPPKRAAYRRPKDEILDKLEEGAAMPQVADTVIVSGLVCRRYDPNRTFNTGGISAKKKGGKDFKRFRKNSIIKGNREFRTMRAVLPKESEVGQALEEQQRTIDAQQRMADELFHGGDSRSKTTKSTTRKRRNV